MNVEKLRRLRAEANDKMKALLDGVEASSRTALNEEESKQYDGYKAEYEAVGKSIVIAQEQESRETELSSFRPAAARGSFSGNPVAEPAKREFECVGEMIYAMVSTRGNDQRLSFVAAGQNLGSGEVGGFAVPEAFSPEIMAFDQSESVIEPLCWVMDAGQYPDAPFNLPVLNQSGDLYAGVSMKWVGDLNSGSALPDAGSAKLKRVRVEPYPLAGHVGISNSLLRNWRSADAFITNLLRKATAHAKENAFFSGDGLKKPLGILKSGGLKKVNRAGSNAIAYTDLTKMERYFCGANPYWLISKAAKEALSNITRTTGSDPLFRDGGQGMAPTFLGYPYKINPRGSALGTLGDILLGDFKYYIVKPGSGPLLAMSEHVKFLEDETVIKCIVNLDGQMWNDSTLTMENGDLASPIVALDVPA